MSKEIEINSTFGNIWIVTNPMHESEQKKVLIDSSSVNRKVCLETLVGGIIAGVSRKMSFIIEVNNNKYF